MSKKSAVLLFSILFVMLASFTFASILTNKTLFDGSQKARLAYWQLQFETMGRPMTMADISHPPIADTLNAAIPFRTFENRALEESDYADNLTEIGGWLAQHQHRFLELSEEEYEQAQELLSRKESQDMLALLLNMQTYPDFFYDADISQGIGFFDLPNFAHYRRLFLSALLNGCVELRKGNVEEGYLWIARGLQHPKMFSKQPTLVTEMMRIVSYDYVAETLIDAIRLYPPDRSTTVRLTEALSQYDYPSRQSIASAMDIERIAGYSFYFQALAGQIIESKLISGWQESRRYFILDVFAFDYYWATYEELHFRVTRQLLSYEPFSPDFYRKIDQLESRFAWNQKDTFFTYAQLFRTIGERSAQFETLPTVLALHLYHLDNGHYPEKWHDLAPDYIDELPLHPFLITPIEYAQVGDNYDLNFREVIESQLN